MLPAASRHHGVPAAPPGPVVTASATGTRSHAQCPLRRPCVRRPRAPYRMSPLWHRRPVGAQRNAQDCGREPQDSFALWWPPGGTWLDRRPHLRAPHEASAANAVHVLQGDADLAALDRHPGLAFMISASNPLAPSFWRATTGCTDSSVIRASRRYPLRVPPWWGFVISKPDVMTAACASRLLR
jgi:hypothetical protein